VATMTGIFLRNRLNNGFIINNERIMADGTKVKIKRRLRILNGTIEKRNEFD
jgi:hypothetical protein